MMGREPPRIRLNKIPCPQPLYFKDQCPICQENLTVDSINAVEEKGHRVLKDETLIRVTCCGKYFHKNCIFPWIQRDQFTNPYHQPCPNCKKQDPEFALNAFAHATPNHDDFHFIALLLSEYITAVWQESWSPARYQQLKREMEGSIIPHRSPEVNLALLRDVMRVDGMLPQDLTWLTMPHGLSKEEAQRRILNVSYKIISAMVFITKLMDGSPQAKSFANIATDIQKQRFFEAYEVFAKNNFHVVQQAARILQNQSTQRLSEVSQHIQKMLQPIRERYLGINFPLINFSEVPWPKLFTIAIEIPKNLHLPPGSSFPLIQDPNFSERLDQQCYEMLKTFIWILFAVAVLYGYSRLRS